MVKLGLDENLYTIVEDGDLSHKVFQLIGWAEAQGRVNELVAAASSANPSNPQLKDWISQWPEMRGPLAYITCNRSDPTRQFRKEIERYLCDTEPGCIHFYVVRGVKEDCPGSFISRLWRYELKQLAEEFAPERWRGDPKVKDVEVGWECRPNQSPDEALDILQDTILREVARDEPRLAPEASIQHDFHSRLRRLAQNYDVLVIRHGMTAQDWHGGMEAFLRQYLALFSAKSETAPFVLLFFTLEQEAANGLLSLFNAGRMERAFSAIQRLFGEAAAAHNRARFCVLKTLEEVDRDEVVALLRNINRKVVDAQIHDSLKPLFGKRKRVRMAEIERYFKIGEDDSARSGGRGAGYAG